MEKYPFHRFAEDSPEYRYLMERREELGGVMPRRIVKSEPLAPPEASIIDEFFDGSGEREVSTTDDLRHAAPQAAS